MSSISGSLCIRDYFGQWSLTWALNARDEPGGRGKTAGSPTSSHVKSPYALAVPSASQIAACIAVSGVDPEPPPSKNSGTNVDWAACACTPTSGVAPIRVPASGMATVERAAAADTMTKTKTVANLLSAT
jgi:hypothetical protein